MCSWSTILKVPRRLRKVSEDAYEPQVLSIGPEKPSSPYMPEMDECKKKCLERVTLRLGKKKVKQYSQDMNIAQAYKKFYPHLSEEDQERAKNDILLDGVFIVELLCAEPLRDFAPIFKFKWIQTACLHDLLLLENQLPFFVLADLYRLSMEANRRTTGEGIIEADPTDGGQGFASKAFAVLSTLLPGPSNWVQNHSSIEDTDNIMHLLSLVHDRWSPSPEGIMRHEEWYKKKLGDEEKKIEGDEENGLIIDTMGEHSYSKYWKRWFGRDKENVRKGLDEWQSIRCATELEEAGIKFVKIGIDSKGNTNYSNVVSLFDIRFRNATMKIPTFVVDDHTERLFRNLIAYELYSQGSTYVLDYVTFMDNLINSAKDVQVLRFSGVIVNMLGDDEAVAQMINKLRQHVTLCGKSFYYDEIFVDVKKHCARRWSIWKAKLSRDYFNSPWALLSFLAALLIILLAIGSFVTALLPLVDKKLRN
ncbi:hypothetical protein COLO4_25737 [Corchorus olitorius]|uniref:Uncharacterized protein n=1 Tax=Corchorus olitorius TaxID=93759 RepID=A0A1R3I0C2_9ROSI|nr:hypothetical protein COLO4_25737 [Corchorus olitorius]